MKCPKGNIRYIGKTTNIKRRLYSHIEEAKRKPKRRYVLNWIKSLLDKGQKPTIHLIEEYNEDVWQEREVYWISYYRERIDNLCNQCNGGLGGTGTKNYSKEQREVLRQHAINIASKFSEKEKSNIWLLIKEGKTKEEIKQVFPKFSRYMFTGVKNGRQWIQITGLSPLPPQRRKGYTCAKGLYIVKDKNKKVIFSSRCEETVKSHLRGSKQVTT